MNRWKVITFFAVCIVVLTITVGYFIHKERRVPMSDLEKEDALKAAMAAVEGRLPSNYTTYVPSTGWRVSKGSTETEVAFISFASEEHSISVLVDLGSMKPVRIIESFGWASNASKRRWMRNS